MGNSGAGCDHIGAVVAVWLGLALSGGILGLVLMSNSEVPKLAIATAESNPRVTERLGSRSRRDGSSLEA